MAIAPVETVQGTAATQASITLATWTPASNDLILLAVLTRQTTVTHTSVAGNGLTWTKLFEGNGGASTNIRGSLWWAQGGSPTTGQITVTLSGAPATAIAIATRFSGANTTTPVEASAGTGNATSATPSVAVTTLTADALAFAAMLDRTATFSVGSGKSALSINNVTGTSGNTLNISTEMLLVPSPGATTMDGTWSAAATWVAIAAAIKPAAGGAPVANLSTRQIEIGGAVAQISGG